jgi:hypothetical protein
MGVRRRRGPGRTLARPPAAPRWRDELRAARVALLAVGVSYGSALRLTSWTWLLRIRMEPSPRWERSRRSGSRVLPPAALVHGGLTGG